MDTTITTVEAIDLGTGPQTTIRVPDSKFRTDDAGTLHVFSDAPRGEAAGSLALAAGEWLRVVRGDLTFNDDDDAVLFVRRNR